MKRTPRFFIVCLVIVILLASLSGCGNPSPIGKYYIKTYDGTPIEEHLIALQKQAGDERPLEEIMKEIGIKSAEEFMTLEFKSDGTLITGYASVPAENWPPIRTWEQKDGKIIINIENGTTAEAVLNGKELTWKNPQGQEFIFVKK